MMKKILFLAMIMFSVAACSSDKLEDEDSNGNGAKILSAQLAGKWDFSKFTVDIQTTDTDISQTIKKEFEKLVYVDNVKKAGGLFFKYKILPNSPQFVDGEMNIKYIDDYYSYHDIGEFYTKGDTILFKPQSLVLVNDDYAMGRWPYTYIKKGNIIYIKEDLTNDYRRKYPQANVTRVSYQIEYKR